VMQGREVFQHAVTKLGDSILVALKANNLTPADIDWFIPHQANLRIIKGVAEHFRLPPEKVIITLGHHGNTSAASIPLALDEAIQSGKVKRGDLIIFEAMGGGLTWGSAAVRW
jgi:3-oxoacyl-[acyl-carrier-protein] synthase-3